MTPLASLIAFYLTGWALATYGLLRIWRTDYPHDTDGDLIVYAATWGFFWFALPALCLGAWVYLRLRR